jgi:hypothetical protein
MFCELAVVYLAKILGKSHSLFENAACVNTAYR